MFRGLSAAAQRELANFRQDRWVQLLAVVLPQALALLFVAIFRSGSPENLPVAVVDLEQSQFSRTIVRQLDASPVLHVTHHFASVSEGKQSLVDGSHYALLVIPANLERQVLLGQSPRITAFFNAQYLLVAKSLRSALLQTEATLATEVDVAEIMVGTPNLSAAIATALPVRSLVGSLYNRNLNYAQFLIPGILFALLQVLICSVSILVVARELKWGGLEFWAGSDATPTLAGKMLPYTVIFTVHLMIYLLLFFAVLDWPYHAGLAALIPLLFLFVIACQALGLFFYALTFNPERGLGFAGAFSAPAFAFLGLTFPASDMSVFARFWRDLMPAAHLADAFIVRTSYGAGMSAFAVPATIFVAFLLLLPWTAARIRARIEETHEPHRSITGA